MKKSILNFSLVTIILASLSACVEVRDAQEKEQPQPVTVAEVGETKPELLIDGEMYVYQGQILTLDQIDLMTYKKTQDWSTGTWILKYGRIEITSRGKLFTLGNNLKIMADQFVSDRGQILTFSKGAKAELNTQGKDGGYLSLYTKSAQGQLFVELRGQDGGDGSSAADRTPYYPLSACQRGFDVARDMNAFPGNPGKKGGDTGSFRVFGATPEDLDIRISRQVGLGGKGGAPGHAGSCFNGFQAFVGAAASDGAPGTDGFVLE